MDSVEEGKKSSTGVPRSANYSQAEKELLVTLMGRYKHVIENKKTDAVTSQVSVQVVFPESIFNYDDLYSFPASLFTNWVCKGFVKKPLLFFGHYSFAY